MRGKGEMAREGLLRCCFSLSRSAAGVAVTGIDASIRRTLCENANQDAPAPRRRAGCQHRPCDGDTFGHHGAAPHTNAAPAAGGGSLRLPSKIMRGDTRA